MLICPRCETAHFKQVAHLELPGDSRSDEIRLQLYECQLCAMRAVAVYEESRRGTLDSESWTHKGWTIDVESWEQLAAQIANCPQPDAGHCDCAIHRSLGGTDALGRWNGLADYRLGIQFPMRRR